MSIRLGGQTSHSNGKFNRKAMNLIGQKINLRYTTLDDADSIAKYCDDKEISRHTIIPHPYTLQNAIDFISHCIDERNTMTSLHFGIEGKKTKEIIGLIDLNSINQNHKRGELGYWLAKPFWLNGIMLEAINLVTDYCFETMELNRIYAHVDPDNIGSWKVLEKAGYTREGLLRNYLCINDIMHDRYIYSKLK